MMIAIVTLCRMYGLTVSEANTEMIVYLGTREMLDAAGRAR